LARVGIATGDWLPLVTGFGRLAQAVSPRPCHVAGASLARASVIDGALRARDYASRNYDSHDHRFVMRLRGVLSLSLHVTLDLLASIPGWHT
jgi:hypothetical protein